MGLPLSLQIHFSSFKKLLVQKWFFPGKQTSLQKTGLSYNWQTQYLHIYTNITYKYIQMRKPKFEAETIIKVDLVGITNFGWKYLNYT